MGLRRLLCGSRRRGRRKYYPPEVIIAIVIFVFVEMTMLSVSVSTKNYSIFLWSTIIGFALVLFVSIYFSLPSVKGKRGEKKVAKILNRLVSKYGGGVINDVIVEDDNGKTSQIDHVYVSLYGIFVIETKNYAGRIYGNDSQQNWTQVLAYGNEKHKLYNPVKQNATHIYRLKNAIKEDVEMTSIVVFVKSNIEYIDSDYVYTPRMLKKLITKEDEPVLSDEVVDRVFQAIYQYKENPIQTTKEHVKEIKQMKNDVNNNICPRCGGNLVLRKGTSGDFYGCSNYPKCKFTKKYS